jgi:hypothetical protein
MASPSTRMVRRFTNRSFGPGLSETSAIRRRSAEKLHAQVSLDNGAVLP